MQHFNVSPFKNKSAIFFTAGLLFFLCSFSTAPLLAGPPSAREAPILRELFSLAAVDLRTTSLSGESALSASLFRAVRAPSLVRLCDRPYLSGTLDAQLMAWRELPDEILAAAFFAMLRQNPSFMDLPEFERFLESAKKHLTARQVLELATLSHPVIFEPNASLRAMADSPEIEMIEIPISPEDGKIFFLGRELAVAELEAIADQSIARTIVMHRRVLREMLKVREESAYDAVDELLRLLSTPGVDKRVRLSLIWILAQLQIKGSRGVTFFIRALEETPNAGIRWRAASELGHLGDSRAISPLISALTDPAEEVRFAAAVALQLIKKKIGADLPEEVLLEIDMNLEKFWEDYPQKTSGSTRLIELGQE